MGSWLLLPGVVLALSALVITSVSASPFPHTPPAGWPVKQTLRSGKAALDCRHPERRLFSSIRPRFKAFVDMEVMAGMLADPDQALRLAELVLDPDSVSIFIACGLEPAIWTAWMNELGDPEKMARAMHRLVSPETFGAWMSGATDPGVRATLARMSGPRLAARWLTALASPTFRNALLPLADPRFYLSRMWRAMRLISARQRSPAGP